MNNTDIILLVEDDELDQKAVLRACRDLKLLNPIVIKENGKEALDYLNAKDLVAPCLILLDLNMPQMGGVEFLKHREKNAKIRLMPTVVLTTSKDERDLIESYKLGVSGYMEKRVDYKSFIEVMRAIHVYWTLSLTPSLPAESVEPRE